jgi:hypothetical protein
MKDLASTFAVLSGMLRRHSAGMVVKIDEPSHFYAERYPVEPKGKPGFFGAVQIRKSYVSYHLMPVYEDPSLLTGISDALRKKMQGKSCFNFSMEDPVLFAELDTLTRRCAESSR